MSAFIKRYSQLSPLPIHIQIIPPFNKHKIVVYNPFSETSSFKGYEYPLRLILEHLLKTPFHIEINILTEHTKFDQIIQFLIPSLSDYTGMCFDNVVISDVEVDNEFTVMVDDKLIVSQRF